jgi:hypothetical protein
MRIRIGAFFALSITLALLTFFAFEPKVALNIYRLGAYPLHLICYGLLVWSLYKVFRESEFSVKATFRSNLPELFVFLIVCGLFISHGHWGFITVSDEPLLVSTSQNLHLNRTPLFIWRAHNFEGTFTVLDAFLDKRPIAFPVLLSLVHDVFGFRHENAFFLNVIMGISGIFMMGLIGRMVAGRIGFFVGVLLMGTLPVYHFYSRGGGFDVFNIVLIELVILLALHWYRSGSKSTFVAFLFAGVILCLSRYEAPIYAASIGLIILYKWIRDKQITLPWIAFAIPFFLALIPLQQKVFELNDAFWELDSIEGADSIFGLRYFSYNLGRALIFFFDSSEQFPNSPFISGLGLLCLVLLLAKLIPSIARPKEWSDEAVIFSAFALSLGGHFVLMMLYFYGQFDGMQLHRFSLPTYVLLILSVIGVVRMLKVRSVHWGIVAIVVIGGFFYSIPTMAKSFYYNKNIHSQKQVWVEEFIESRKGENYFIIDRTPMSWTLRGIPAINYRQSNHVWKEVDFHMKNGNFENVYIVGGYMYDEVTGDEIFMARAAPSQRYSIERISTDRIHPFFEVRVAKVTSIDMAEEPLESESQKVLESDDTVVPELLLEEENMEAKKEFYRMLP